MISVYPRLPKTVKQLDMKHQVVSVEFRETLPTKLIQGKP